MTRSTPPSRRDRHKQDKRDRIHAAALTLFTRQGFDATTVRQIAAEADVATGTVFLYATDKADLLLMVFHDVIARTIEQALDPRRLAGPLPQVLPGLFDPFFAFYEERPLLAGDFLRLVLFHQSPWRTQELAQGHAFVQQLADLLRQRQQTGEVAPDVDTRTAAFALFALYQACLVNWLSGGVSLADTRQHLRNLLHLQVRAFQSAEARK